MDGRLRFSATPDYEVSGHGADYAVTVQAAVAGQQGNPFTLAVTATVVNVDEAGVVNLSSEQPEVGVALTATLSDPDGGVSGATWKWAAATSKNGAWINISGATSAVYTPAMADAGHYLRATASYGDAEGTGKRARGISDNPLSGGRRRNRHAHVANDRRGRQRHVYRRAGRGAIRRRHRHHRRPDGQHGRDSGTGQPDVHHNQLEHGADSHRLGGSR